MFSLLISNDSETKHTTKPKQTKGKANQKAQRNETKQSKTKRNIRNIEVFGFSFGAALAIIWLCRRRDSLTVGIFWHLMIIAHSPWVGLAPRSLPTRLPPVYRFLLRLIVVSSSSRKKPFIAWRCSASFCLMTMREIHTLTHTHSQHILTHILVAA